ncbi:sodium:solute symporter family transporter [Streptomyces jumonjinensis]|uniref:sodium:solute symporter family transporter n=1 Tax=Streptomyces jumonjinensis TaxID=1945 RepID=UPI0037BC11AC
MAVDYAVIVVYLAGMLAMGWWGMRRAKSKSEFLVAGRRLGPWMYSGTMAAIVLGGASTIGGVGLGYKYGLSGAWMVLTIGLGLLALSVFFSARIARLKVYTVSEMLDLRYGGRAGMISGLVMWAYTLMLAVTSTIAYATIFDVLFDIDRTASIVLAAALAAVMSTSSGALIACATVANNDIWSRLRGLTSRAAPEDGHDEVKGNRVFILAMGVAVIAIAIVLNDVVEALTVAYNLLVGGLLVPILGGLLWKRGTVQGALAAVGVGGVAVIGLMAAYGILAEEPVYYGLLASLAVYVTVSLLTRPTDAAVLAHWRERLAGRGSDDDAPATATATATPGQDAQAR